MNYRLDPESNYWATNKVLPIRFLDSPYYQTCVDAFAHDDTKVIRPYEAAFFADYNGQPLSYDPAEANPKFLEQVYSGYVQVEDPYIEQPYVTQCIQEQTEGHPAGAKVVKRRAIVILLLLVFSLLALAIPIVSSLAILPDYIDLDVDVLKIADAFSELSLDAIKTNSPVIILAAYMLLSLILVIISLCALFIRKKKSFFIVALLALIAAVAFALSIFKFDFNALLDKVTDLNYGIYGLIGCPILVLVLSFLAYKKLR